MWEFDNVRLVRVLVVLVALLVVSPLWGQPTAVATTPAPPLAGESPPAEGLPVEPVATVSPEQDLPGQDGLLPNDGNNGQLVHGGEHTPPEPLPADPFVAEGGAVLVRDEAGLFDAPLHSQLRLQLLKLRRSTGIELFLVTRVVNALEEVEVVAYDLFKSLVREVGHYKVILVLVAIDRKKGQGTVSTNLGAGVYHLVDRKDCEGLFVREGQAFSPEGVKQGMAFLCGRIETAAAERRKADLVTGNVTEQPDESFLGKWGLFIAISVLALLGLFGYFYIVGRTTCPRCGAELKTKVNIVVGTGGSDLARKTYKCFKCGYTRRRALLPTSLVGKKR